MHNNFAYREFNRTKYVVSWRCNLLDKNKCKVKIYATSTKICGKILDNKFTVNYNHSAEKSNVKALKVKNKIKKLATNSAETFMNMIAKSTLHLHVYL